MTGEMYTAPTGSENKQLTDAIKLLGTVNAMSKIIEINNHSINATIGLGGGGWNDYTPPYQKHVFKQSTLIEYQLKLKNERRIGTQLGATYLFAEGNRNKGIHWKTGIFYKQAQI